MDHEIKSTQTLSQSHREKIVHDFSAKINAVIHLVSLPYTHDENIEKEKKELILLQLEKIKELHQAMLRLFDFQTSDQTSEFDLPTKKKKLDV